MKIVMIMALLAHGRMSFSEIGPYETVHSCMTEFYRLVDRYVADGYDLKNINGGCYYKPQGSAQ